MVICYRLIGPETKAVRLMCCMTQAGEAKSTHPDGARLLDVGKMYILVPAETRFYSPLVSDRLLQLTAD
jgi:hypothetical protein